MRGSFALLLLGLGAVMLAWAAQRSAVLKHGVETRAVVREVYGSDPERSNEVWLEYTDQQGGRHWLHGKMAAHPRRGAEMPVKYSADQPDRALLLSEPSHYDFVTVIFGLYFVGYGLFMGYRLCTKR